MNSNDIEKLTEQHGEAAKTMEALIQATEDMRRMAVDMLQETASEVDNVESALACILTGNSSDKEKEKALFALELSLQAIRGGLEKKVDIFMQ